MSNFFRQEVLDLPSYHLEAHEGVKLNQNESPWDIPVELKALVVENLLRVPWNRYPLDDLLILKKKMAKLLEVWPDNLVFSNGSNVLIQALTFATSIQKEVMVLDPTFGVYEIEARLFSNQVMRIPLEDDFSIPKDKILRAIKRRPGIIFLPNPNAPTGNLFDPDLLRKIVATAECLVVIDEAYYPFSSFTVLDWVKEYDNLVVLRTFSKAFALGGLRLGWMIAEPEAARQVQKCLLPFCISRLVMAATLAVLDSPGYVKRYVKQICDERERVYRSMTKFSDITVYPSQANFILLEVDDSEKIFKTLLEEKVIVRQVNDGRRLTKALRVSIGTPEENDIFLLALRKALV